MYYFRFVFVLLLFEPQTIFSHAIVKPEISNDTDVFEVKPLPDNGLQLIDNNPKEPSLFEIIYYHIIRKPFGEVAPNNDTPKRLDFDQSVRPFTNGQGYQFVEWKPEEIHPVEAVQDVTKKPEDKDTDENSDEDDKKTSLENDSVEKPASAEDGKKSDKDDGDKKDDKSDYDDEDQSAHDRRKREINDENIPPAPTLPDLNLNELPSDVRKIYENSPDFAKYFVGSDENGSAAPKEDENQIPALKKSNHLSQNLIYTNNPQRDLNPPKETIYENTEPKDNSFKEKALHMFNEIPSVNGQGGTYGMDLTGDHGTVWNDLNQTPVGIESNQEPNSVPIESNENKIDKDNQGNNWSGSNEVSQPASNEKIIITPVTDEGVEIPPAPKIVEPRPDEEENVPSNSNDNNVIVQQPVIIEPTVLDNAIKNSNEDVSNTKPFINNANSGEPQDDFKNRAIAMFNNMPNDFANKEEKPKTYGMDLVGNKGVVWNDLNENPVGNDNVGVPSENTYKPPVSETNNDDSNHIIYEYPKEGDESSNRPIPEITKEVTQRPVVVVVDKIPESKNSDENNSVEGIPSQQDNDYPKQVIIEPKPEPDHFIIENPNTPEYNSNENAIDNKPTSKELKDSFNNLLKQITPLKPFKPQAVIKPKSENEDRVANYVKPIPAPNENVIIVPVQPERHQNNNRYVYKPREEIHPNAYNRPARNPTYNNKPTYIVVPHYTREKKSKPVQKYRERNNKPNYDEDKLKKSFENLNNQLNNMQSKSNPVQASPGTYGMRLHNGKGYMWNDLNPPQNTFVDVGEDNNSKNKNKPTNEGHYVMPKPTKPHTTQHDYDNSANEVETSPSAETSQSNEEPSSSNEEPTSSNEEPSSSNEEPSSSNEEPTSSNEEPSSSNEEPSSSNEEPTSSNEKPTSSNRKPSSSNERPSSSNEKPTSSNRKPSSSNERPSSSNEKPTSSNRRPSSSNERPYHSNEEYKKPSREESKGNRENFKPEKPQSTEHEYRHSKPSEKPKQNNNEPIKKENPESQDKNPQNKPKENKPKDFTKEDLDNLLNKKVFWDWLAGWTKKYMDLLNQRLKDMIKQEVANQLKNAPARHQNPASDDNQSNTSNRHPKDENNNTEKPSSNSTPKKNTDRKDDNGPTAEKANKPKATNNNRNKNSNPKHNKPTSNSKPKYTSKKFAKAHSKNNQEKEKPSSDSNAPSHNNNTSVDVNADTVYGNTVGHDHINNVFVFFNGNGTEGNQGSGDNKPSKENSNTDKNKKADNSKEKQPTDTSSEKSDEQDSDSTEKVNKPKSLPAEEKKNHKRDSSSDENSDEGSKKPNKESKSPQKGKSTTENNKDEADNNSSDENSAEANEQPTKNSKPDSKSNPADESEPTEKKKDKNKKADNAKEKQPTDTSSEKSDEQDSDSTEKVNKPKSLPAEEKKNHERDSSSDENSDESSKKPNKESKSPQKGKSTTENNKGEADNSSSDENSAEANEQPTKNSKPYRKLNPADNKETKKKPKREKKADIKEKPRSEKKKDKTERPESDSEPSKQTNAKSEAGKKKPVVPKEKPNRKKPREHKESKSATEKKPSKAKESKASKKEPSKSDEEKKTPKPKPKEYRNPATNSNKPYNKKHTPESSTETTTTNSSDDATLTTTDCGCEDTTPNSTPTEEQETTTVVNQTS